MITTMVGYSLEFLVQAALLFAALWIMIRVQNLNYNFLGLAGTAVLTTLVDMGVEHFLGTYISTGVVVGVLSFCVWKVTQAEQVDVAFTVMVGAALVFVMELFLLGALMGDLRPSAESSEMEDLVELAEEMEREAALQESRANDHRRTELAAVITNAPSPAPPGKPSRTAVGTTPALTKAAPDPALKFTLKGVTKSGKNSIALVHSGVKGYPISQGESVSMQTADGRVIVRCAEIEDTSVVLEMSGRRISLSLE